MAGGYSSFIRQSAETFSLTTFVIKLESLNPRILDHILPKKKAGHIKELLRPNIFLKWLRLAISPLSFPHLPVSFYMRYTKW